MGDANTQQTGGDANTFSQIAEGVFTGEPDNSGAGSGGDGANASTSTDTSDASQQQGQQQQGDQQQQQQPARLTDDDVKRIADAARPQQGQQQQQQYTQDQLDEMFKVWKPDQKFVDQLLGGGEDALKAVVSMREALLTQFNTITDYRLKLLQQDMMKQVQPAIAVAQERAAERERDAFFKEHEDLKDNEDVVNIAFASLMGEKAQYKTVADARKALADRTRQLLGKRGDSGNGSTAGTQTTQTQTQHTKKPATLNRGSQAGGGATGGGSAASNVFSDIFSEGA